MIVVDTNVIAFLYLTGRWSDASAKALALDPDWAAPTLWRSAFQNVLVGHLRQGKLSLDEALGIIDEAEDRMYGSEYTAKSHAVLVLATESTCTAYDCEFVALAKELGVSLVTLDREVLREFTQTAVSLDAFVSGEEPGDATRPSDSGCD